VKEEGHEGLVKGSNAIGNHSIKPRCGLDENLLKQEHVSLLERYLKRSAPAKGGGKVLTQRGSVPILSKVEEREGSHGLTKS